MFKKFFGWISSTVNKLVVKPLSNSFSVETNLSGKITAYCKELAESVRGVMMDIVAFFVYPFNIGISRFVARVIFIIAYLVSFVMLTVMVTSINFLLPVVVTVTWVGIAYICASSFYEEMFEEWVTIHALNSFAVKNRINLDPEDSKKKPLETRVYPALVKKRDWKIFGFTINFK